MTATVRSVGRQLGSHWPAVAIFAGVIVLWQLAVSFLGLREYLLPSPMAVLRAMFGEEIPWGKHIWVTAVEILGAFVIAGVGGVWLWHMAAPPCWRWARTPSLFPPPARPSP